MVSLIGIALLAFSYCITVTKILCEVSTCFYPPCRYAVYRGYEDQGNVVVNDASSHAMNWLWEVKGGRWNVTYHYIYPSGWYEGIAQFINCSDLIDGKAQAFVSWSSSKPWESNAIHVYANAWNISYNGDVFGFVPTGNGKYIFRIYSKNRRHNPFSNEEIILPPGSCHFASSDKAQIKAFWSERKRLRNCALSSFDWTFHGNSGRWRVYYRWDQQSDIVQCVISYALPAQNEQGIINWELNIPKNSVTYTSNPIKIYNEPAWNINLNPQEYWGFSPVGQGSWIIQHFSRNLVFQPSRS